MNENTYVEAITFLAIASFTFFITGALNILDASLLYNAGLSAFAYMLMLCGFASKRKKLFHYIYILIGGLILLIIALLYITMAYRFFN